MKSDPEDKVKLLLDYSDDPRDIADPWYTGGFDVTYSDVVEGCEAFLEYLKDKKETVINIVDEIYFTNSCGYFILCLQRLLRGFRSLIFFFPKTESHIQIGILPVLFSKQERN